jgi:hypothetical protein
MRTALHLFLHGAVPIAIAWIWFRPQWLRASAVMIATMLVDLDHLLAHPIFDPQRCSIGFHPLHSWYALPVYAVLAAFRRTRLVGIGLLIHMALDGVDCLAMR